MSYEDDFNHLKIQLEDIIKATNNFGDKLIGIGGFGKVYKGELNLRSTTTSVVAFKRLDRQSESGQGDIEFWKEIVMLSKLRHENLVSLLHFCNEGDERILVYEYASRGSLNNHLGDPNLTWTMRLQICIGVARGLKYLHTPRETKDRVLHRDIKSSNILLDEKWNAKLSDFGLSKIGPANQSRSYLISNVVGTHGYCDPWYYKTNELTKESDVYSFGVVLFEVMCGRICHEFHDGYKVRILVDAWQKCYDEQRLSDVIYDDSNEKIDEESLKTFSTVANRCLNYKRVERPLMVEIIQELDIALQQQQRLVRAMNMRNEFCIPDYILVPGGKIEDFVPVCPTIVFVNSKSGGQLGGELLLTYRSVLNKNQVFDLGEEAPDKVLRRLYLTLENLKLNGDALAAQIEKNLRIIVAGGDGTAGWLLGVVSDLQLSLPPPIATMPLGTENNLPFAFGWGKKNPKTTHESVLHFLDQVKKGREMEIDSWHFLMRMKSLPKEGSCDPIRPLELPHSLHTFSHMSESDTDELNVSGYDTFHGGFWNYFSMGMDAQVSYAFHCERKLHPNKFKNQLANQSTYAKIGRTQEGWFASSLFRPSSKNIALLVKVKIMRRHGVWEDLEIHHSIRSIVCLNLPSFSGGLNPWGTPNKDKARDRDLTPPYVDDGFLEIVGFRDAWHGLVLLAPKGHCTRLAQTQRVRFEFDKGEAECTYMTMDGEPWRLPLPVDDYSTVVEISHLGRVKMLATQNWKSRSVNDPSTPHHNYQEEDSDYSENEEDPPMGEEWRKFGAAETFKIPEDVDISRLS